MLIAACQYDGLERLKRMCEQYLQPYVLDMENTCTIFRVADTYNSTFLRGMALYYITAHIAQVQNTESWNELTDAQKQYIREKSLEWKLL